jgi:Fur family transcriptional regulator, ferric uptake regulator
MRKTNRRNAIQAAFQQNDRLLGIDEIPDAGRQTVKSLNQATAYRNLKLLVDKGWLRETNTPESGALYEISGKEHRRHFQRRSCDRLFEISG